MLTLIIGTNRPGSNSRRLGRVVEEIYAGLGVPLRVLDLADLPPAIFSPAAYETKPPEFARFTEAILQAEGLILISPEYNGGPPGVLKYFIDMLKFPESFEQRPVCFIGVAAGIWGALRPIEQLQMIFGYRNAYLFPERVLLARIHELLDTQGQLKDPEITGRLQRQAGGFVEFVEKIKGVPLRAGR